MRPNASTTRAHGFTIIELLFTIAVVGVLIGLISVGIWGARRVARGASDQFTASGLGAATEQFKSDFGFLPPLVIDGDPLLRTGEEGPIIEDPRRNNLQRIALRDPAFLLARRANGQVDDTIAGEVNGWAGPQAAYSDKRYSKLSLPYYLMGACNSPRDPGATEPVPIDGVRGAGFRTPLRDGRFEPGGRTFEPFYAPREADRLVRGYGDRWEFREHTGSDPGTVDAGDESVALVDATGRAFRYYRWTNGSPEDPGDELGEFMNVPKVFQDPHTWQDRDASASGDVAGGSYAILGAGPDGLFGTEPVEVLESVIGNRVNNNDPEAVLELRRIAQEDNVLEVGR